jgi:acyl-CoA synthetase (AMP-forming)/AMP-acid ligase II
MQGYYGLPERTAETLRDGWLFTGDVALERDGTYYLLDRVDNRIISGGENIYPQEVERVLEDHPDVLDAAVRGEPDPSLGELVAAYVVSRDPDLSLSDIESFWRGRTDIADFKRPRRLTLLEELPRNQSGKILRNELGSDAE